MALTEGPLSFYYRSEIHVPSVSLRFSLILEAYCRGNIWHIRLLIKQVKCRQIKLLSSSVSFASCHRDSGLTPSSIQNEALLKMKTLSDIVKTGSQRMTVDDLKLCIKQESYQESLSDLLSPLNPSVVLAEIWLVSDTHTHRHLTK